MILCKFDQGDAKSKGGQQRMEANQRDRSIEVYHETMRQRNSKSKVNFVSKSSPSCYDGIVIHIRT